MLELKSYDFIGGFDFYEHGRKYEVVVNGGSKDVTEEVAICFSQYDPYDPSSDSFGLCINSHDIILYLDRGSELDKLLRSNQFENISGPKLSNYAYLIKENSGSYIDTDTSSYKLLRVFNMDIVFKNFLENHRLSDTAYGDIPLIDEIYVRNLRIQDINQIINKFNINQINSSMITYDGINKDGFFIFVSRLKNDKIEVYGHIKDNKYYNFLFETLGFKFN